MDGEAAGVMGGEAAGVMGGEAAGVGMKPCGISGGGGS